MDKLNWLTLARNSQHLRISKSSLYIAFPRHCSNSENDKNQKDAKRGNDLEKDAKKEKSQIVLNKLNILLKEMAEIPKAEKLKMSVKLARPPIKKQKEVTLEDKPLSEGKSHTVTEKVMVKAAQEVAKSLGGDMKQTESELMKKFLNSTQDDDVPATILSLSDIVKGMKIDRSQGQKEQQSRSQQVKQILSEYQKKTQRRPQHFKQSRTQSMRKISITKLDNIDLFGAEPLGIFTADPSEYRENVKNETWEKLKQNELKLAITHLPSNYFQELILWTEQGKLWKFPIDNEQGLEEEQNVSFAEHVFLEEHLEPWCPPKGPIRHFMELVCVGLSKNPYLSANAKKEHIVWYQNYFEDKRQLLKEVGASLNEVEQAKKLE